MHSANFFLLNVVINSLLTFFTTVCLVKGIIFLFRIKPGRLSALLKMIPLIKLPLDLFRYNFPRWSYVHGINPFHCEEGTRSIHIGFGWTNSISNWLFSAIEFTTFDNLTFTVADLIGHLSQPLWLTIFVLLLVSLTLIFLLQRLIGYYRSHKAFKNLLENSQPVLIPVVHPKLQAIIKKKKCAIFTSTALRSSPLVQGIGSPKIYIPSTLYKDLSQKEYEAILTHEIEHVVHRDICTHLILDLITSLFWWIPSKWLRHQIDEDLEISCDRGINKYSVNPVDLASAIHKSIKNSSPALTHPLGQHLAKIKSLKRVHFLLQPDLQKRNKITLIFSCLALIISIFLILFGRFWIF